MTASVRVRERSRDPRSDETLVRTCNRGGPGAAAAFEALYRRHRDYVPRVALRFAPDLDTALAVLQETFLQLLRKFPPSGDGIELTARLTTLLYPIARNAAIDARRRAARLPVDADVTPDDLAAAPEPAFRWDGEVASASRGRAVAGFAGAQGLFRDRVNLFRPSRVTGTEDARHGRQEHLRRPPPGSADRRDEAS